jgi:competence protein ComGC
MKITKPSISSHKERGLTLIELFVILAVIAALAALLIPALIRAKATAQRISCVSCLKQIGLGTRVWEGDHTNLYPMQVSSTNGGTMDFITGPNAFRHFQVMSNELSTPWVLICSAESDRIRARATNFDFLSNSNVSYFVGIDANETNPQMILSGDRNITNGTAVKNGLLDLTTNKDAGWTAELHKGVGNFGLSDGSVQQVSITGLRVSVANTGLATNRLQMPVLTP